MLAGAELTRTVTGGRPPVRFPAGPRGAGVLPAGAVLSLMFLESLRPTVAARSDGHAAGTLARALCFQSDVVAVRMCRAASAQTGCAARRRSPAMFGAGACTGSAVRSAANEASAQSRRTSSLAASLAGRRTSQSMRPPVARMFWPVICCFTHPPGQAAASLAPSLDRAYVRGRNVTFLRYGMLRLRCRMCIP